jgi:hypothetical protein
VSPPGEVVRVRQPQRALLPFYVLMLVPIALLTLNVWTMGDELGLGPWPYVAWGVLLLPAVVLVAHGVLRPLGVDLRDDAAVVVGPLRNREVPWRDVQAVTFGTRGDTLTLYLADRTEVRCRYPSHSMLYVPSKRVDADFHRVGQWWLAHRGPDRQPLPPPPSAYVPYPPLRPER